MLFRIGEVEGLAVFAAVDFGVGAVLLADFVAEEVPALQMARAELAFLVFLVACAHARETLFYYRSVA